MQLFVALVWLLANRPPGTNLLEGYRYAVYQFEDEPRQGPFYIPQRSLKAPLSWFDLC